MSDRAGPSRITSYGERFRGSSPQRNIPRKNSRLPLSRYQESLKKKMRRRRSFVGQRVDGQFTSVLFSSHGILECHTCGRTTCFALPDSCQPGQPIRLYVDPETQPAPKPLFARVSLVIVAWSPHVMTPPTPLVPLAAPSYNENQSLSDHR